MNALYTEFNLHGSAQEKIKNKSKKENHSLTKSTNLICTSKGRFHPITGHGDPDGGVGGQGHTLSVLTRESDLVPIVQEAG